MNIAICGLGTVGSGVIKVIEENQDLIQATLNEPLVVTHIYSNNIKNTHQADLSKVMITNDLSDILTSDVSLVVETMGGIDFTYQLHKQVIASGKHIVSANKDMLACHVDELSQLANDRKVQLGYEGACVGGVPIINALTHSLQANRIDALFGILNGTSNYILTKMSEFNWSYEEALAKAQALGYAEKDPTNDVEGYDARFKLALLARLAFNVRINPEEIAVSGISAITTTDIQAAKDEGYVFKLIASAVRQEDRLMLKVAPTKVAINHPLATVVDVNNGVFVRGNAVGELFFAGPGAGSLQTASAVVSDIMNVAKFGFNGNLIVKQQAKLASAGDVKLTHEYPVLDVVKEED